MSTVTEEGQGPGLATRFFIGAAVVIVVTVGLSVALASGKAEGVARERIRGELLRVPALFAGWRDSQMSARRGQVRAVAEQPGTKALLAEGGGGPETAHDTSLEFARALGAGAVFLFDTQGRLIVRTDRPREEGGRDFSGVSWVSVPLVEGMGYWAVNPKRVGQFKPIPGRHEFGDVAERMPRPEQKPWN